MPPLHRLAVKIDNLTAVSEHHSAGYAHASPHSQYRLLGMEAVSFSHRQ